MPIPEHELQGNFVVVDAGTTVDELRVQISQQEAVEYIVIVLPDGRFGAAHLSEIGAAVARLGSTALSLPLSRLPNVAEPIAAVQRTEIGFGEAERLRDRQPRRRLVVLEGDRPAGIMVNEARGSSAGGVPFDLFGRERKLTGDALQRRLAAQQPKQVCPACGLSFLFYELQPERKAYACPHCHTVLA